MQTLISSSEIEEIVSRLADKINGDYCDENNVVVIGILTGSVFFVADLVRRLTCVSELDFVEVSSYVGTTSSGTVRIVKDTSLDLKGRHVLIVEDIADTGRTLDAVQKMLLLREPASLKTAVLLNKPSRREVEVPLDYVGREIDDVFVVGYGLDYQGCYRNLPEVSVLHT